MTSTNSIPRIGAPEKAGFLGFSASNNIVFIFKNTYYLFFLTNVCGIDPQSCHVVYFTYDR